MLLHRSLIIRWSRLFIFCSCWLIFLSRLSLGFGLILLGRLCLIRGRFVGVRLVGVLVVRLRPSVLLLGFGIIPLILSVELSLCAKQSRSSEKQRKKRGAHHSSDFHKAPSS